MNCRKFTALLLFLTVTLMLSAQATVLKQKPGSQPAPSQQTPHSRPSTATPPSASSLQSSSQTSSQSSGKVTYVYLEQADFMIGDQDRFPGAQLLQGNVRFRHDDAILTCDSAYFYQQSNSFNAYGHVKIVQGDTLFVYGDVLYYDGNIKMARLRHNVRMENRDVRLTTDSLNYDRLNNVGYYFNNGKITDKTNVLVSVLGHYFPGTKVALFRHKVKMTNPKFVMLSDTLRYNTDTKIASIVGPTNIVYDEDTHIYSELGWYHTQKEQAKLLKNSYVQHSSGKQLIADTIFYDKLHGKGEGFSHVQLVDTVNKMNLYGHYGYYIEHSEEGLVTDSALLIDSSSKDTLYLHADTLYTIAKPLFEKNDSVDVDSIETTIVGAGNVPVAGSDKLPPSLPSGRPISEGQAPPKVGVLPPILPKDSLPDVATIALTVDSSQVIASIPDSLALVVDIGSTDSVALALVPIDSVAADARDSLSIAQRPVPAAQDSTYKIVIGYPNVRFFRHDLQGVADSSYYNTRDSILYLMKKPVVWTEVRQLNGDTIVVYSHNGEVERAVIIGQAFATEQMDSLRYNQMSGKEIIGYIRDGKLHKVDINGSAESLYFPKEDDGTLIGMNQTQSSFIVMYFKDDKIDRIVWRPATVGAMIPIEEPTKEQMYLKNFTWQDAVRPLDRYDVFRSTRKAAEAASATAIDTGHRSSRSERRTRRASDDDETKAKTTSTSTNRPAGFATPSFPTEEQSGSEATPAATTTRSNRAINTSTTTKSLDAKATK